MPEPDDPAVAILPYALRLAGPLADVPLDALEWPLGRPARLGAGRVADMGARDHLLTYPKTRLYFARWGHVSARVSLMIVEPDAIHAKHLRLARLFRRRFHRVLTKSPDLLAALPNARKLVFGWSLIDDPETLDLTKTRACSLVASAKRDLPGHRLRHSVVDRIRESGLEVDIMGRGYRPFAAKEDGLAPYRFSIIIENCREPSYFSEKLVDCLICRTVPIYWGAPDIGEYFDTGGMILCDGAADILDALSDLSEARYDGFSGVMEENSSRALHFARMETRAARLLLDRE